MDETPGNYLIIDIDAPRYTMLYANKVNLMNSKSELNDLIGNALFDVFPDDSGSKEKVTVALEQVIIKGKSYRLAPLRYDIPIKDSENFETKYWSLDYTPIFDEEGRVEYILQTAFDITKVIQSGFPLSI